MMKFKVFLLLLFFAFFIIGDISAKISGRGRISSGGGSRRGGYSRTSSSGSYSASSGTSYGSVSHGTSHGTPHGGTSRGGISPGTSYGGISHGTSHGTPHVGTSSSVAHSSGKVIPQQNKDVNTHFLNAEGGGATRPVETKPSQPSHGNLYPPSPSSGYGHVPNIERKPGLVTESRQTSSIQPSAPQDHVMKSSAGTLQTQGYPTNAANPPWSNPYLHDNKPSISGQFHPSPNYNPGVNKPTVPAAQPPPIGFKDHVYPQSSPTSGNSQVGHPPYPIGHPPYPTGHSSYPTGHPPYPSGHSPYPSAHPPYSGGSAPYPYPSHSSGTFQTPPSSSFPIHPSNSVPMANPYSMHSPGQTYYPQQPHVFAQPASQPFVPGQTILMMPGQQDSGRGFGQMVKEALVFSTINAGVNRLINPHTHNYIESRPDTASPATTHVTYNNQYFNTPPGVNGATNPINVPPESVPNSNPYPSGTFTPNVGASNGPSGIINPNVGTSNSPSGTINPNVGTNNGPTLGNVNTYIPNIANSGVPSSSGTNSGVPISNGSNSGVGGIVNNTATGSNTSNDQTNSFGNSNGADNTFFYRISDKELYHITEELFAKSSLNISKYIKLNLQNRVSSSNSSNITDQANERLFYVEPELLEHPTIYLTRSLYDSYQHDYLKKLNRTIETRKQENLLIDTFLNTNVMSTAMDWLADYGFIDPDDFERKDVLRRIWFTMFSGSTCGFERVFASENYGTAIIGAQDWLYFENQESLGRIDYMGYLDKLDLGNTSSLLKLNFQMDGIIRPNATIFVGTLPELEMSLYTICFYARSNNICPVSLGGTKFNIYTHSFMYFGNEVIDLGLPIF